MKLEENIIAIESTDSTNNFAKNWIKNHVLKNHILIYTHYQTSGRGQRQKTWESEPNSNILFTYIYRPNSLKINEGFKISMIVSLTILQWLKTFNIDASIKWPNDIYINHKKLAGILIENSISNDKIESSYIGIGINCNQQYFKTPNAISISNIIDKSIDIIQNINSIYQLLYQNLYLLMQNSVLQLKQQYLNLCYAYNTFQKFEINNRIVMGKIININEYGHLEVLIDNQIQTFQHGEIKMIINL